MTDPPRSTEFEAVEGELRAMLQRRSADVQPERPAWDTLDPGVTRSTPSPDNPWVRPLLAAASVIVLAAVGAVVLDRVTGSGDQEPAMVADEGGDTTSTLQNAGIPVPVPGSEDFDPAVAAPIYPVGHAAELADLPGGDLDRLEDHPEEVARAYLAEVSISDGSGSVADMEVGVAEAEEIADARGGGTAEEEPLGDEVAVAWSTWDETGPDAISSGHVYLRRTEIEGDDGVARRPWLVVGSRTHGIRLQDVRRDDGTLSFTLNRRDDDTGLDRVHVEVDGDPVGNNISAGAALPLQRPVDPDEVAVIRVQHLDPTNGDGEPVPVSIVEMAVPHAGM